MTDTDADELFDQFFLTGSLADMFLDPSTATEREGTASIVCILFEQLPPDD